MNKPITIFDRGYDENGQLPTIFEKDNFFQNNFTQAVHPSTFLSGELPSNLTIKGYLQSDGFIAGSTGWKLDSDGNLEANSGSFTGEINASSGSFTGSINVGSTSNTKIDGVNNRIIVNDGVTDRILIGKAVGLF